MEVNEGESGVGSGGTEVGGGDFGGLLKMAAKRPH
jgi:hypothetical protein